MSSSSVTPQVSVLLAELLQGEKGHIRVCLRAEMDRLVDQMLHSFFQRLTNKLAICHQPHSTGYEPENDPEILAQVKREIKEEENEMTLKNLMDNTTQTNQDCDEYEDPLEEDMSHEVCHIPQNGHFHQVDSTQPNGQVNSATDNDNPQQDWNEPEIEEGDNGQMMQVDEDDEETEIEDNEGDDEESRTVENTQTETTLPHHNGQTRAIVRRSTRNLKRKQTDDEQLYEVNNQEDTDGNPVDEEEVTSRSVKRPRPSRSTTPSRTNETQIITLTLQCPQEGCNEMIDKDKFKKHMEDEHSVGPIRCAVKDCGQAFDNRMNLRHHLTQSHQSTTEWLCEKCDKHFTSHPRLSAHYTQHHEIGHFQCSFSSCQFTGECRKKVYTHYAQRHKKILKCPQCPYETANAAHYRQHQRAHLGIKPYKCTKCDFAATERSSTIVHISRMHFKGKPSSRVRLDDYVEVNEMLLDNPVGRDNVGNGNTQIITHSLQCPECNQMFAKDKFNKHLKVKHSISPFRCLVTGCNRSFYSSAYLRGHLAQCHQSITKWHCDKCVHHFASYEALSTHHAKQHQLGRFQCSSCQFTCEFKRKVYDHYTAQHNPRALMKCPLPGCQFQTQKMASLKQHQRVHLGIKPFRCKWRQCHFASANKTHAIRHIRQIHLERQSAVSPNPKDPNDFLDVVHELL